MGQYHNLRIFDQDFFVDEKFQLIKPLGQGAYGIVCSARYNEEDSESNTSDIAIKKITNIFSKKIICKRALREIKLLRHFRGHKNITHLYDLDIVSDQMGNFNEIYLYEELMECDMHQIIKSNQPLTDSHFQSFIYQTLCGLKYIHSANVLHRDLKPGNLLVNAECDLKIADFGLARGYSNEPEKNIGFLTEYVTTRWYRAPEIILSFQEYTKAIDIWSVGCILAELLGRHTIFKGSNYIDQLNQIFHVLGLPSDDTITSLKSDRARDYLIGLKHDANFMNPKPLNELYPQATPLSLDLLSKMLCLDPRDRITVEEALEHPYLEIWHSEEDEPECLEKFDFSFEIVDDLSTMRDMLISEVQTFREFVRKPLEDNSLDEDDSTDQSSSSIDQQQQQQQQQQHQQQSEQQNSSQQFDFPSVSSIQNNATNALQQPQLETPSAENFDFSDLPPIPEETMINNYPTSSTLDSTTTTTTTATAANQLNGGFFDLEQELQYGLDGLQFRDTI